MDRGKRRRLARMGGRLTTPRELLGLDEQEAAMVQVRLLLADHLRKTRDRRGLTQTELAEAMGSSQSRVAKMEAADPGVSLDLVLRALFVLGVGLREVGRVIGRGAA